MVLGEAFSRSDRQAFSGRALHEQFARMLRHKWGDLGCFWLSADCCADLLQVHRTCNWTHVGLKRLCDGTRKRERVGSLQRGSE